jgi:hypothetical protein
VISFTVDDVASWIKAYEAWCAGAVAEVRACPHCPCAYRHKHGYVSRQVAWDLGVALVLMVLRLRCPGCGRTERVRPPWLPARSPYPWPVQELAAVAYLADGCGYRPVADAHRLDPTELWRWVDRLAAASVDWVVHVAAEIVRWGRAVPAVTPDVARVAVKARSTAKADRLSRLEVLWPLLGALAGACRPWMPELEAPGPGMALTFWSAYRASVPER